MTRNEFIEGLYVLAKWYKDNPDFPLPNRDTLELTISQLDTKEEALQFAAKFAPLKKEYGGDIFSLIKTVGPFEIKAVFWRKAVCTRRVVGTRKVGAVPEHDVEVVEWDCNPLLRP
jgi:hypothetical protein